MAWITRSFFRSPVWMVAVSTVFGVAILVGAYVLITTNCPPNETTNHRVCEALYTRPPWILLSGLAGAVGILWSWWLRTVTRKEAEDRAERLARDSLKAGERAEQLAEKEIEAKNKDIEAKNSTLKKDANESFLNTLEKAIEMIESEKRRSIIAGIRILARLVRSSLEEERWPDAASSLETLVDIKRSIVEASEEDRSEGDNEVMQIIDAATRSFTYAGAHLANIVIPHIDIYKAKLEGANLTEADLQWADLRRAILTRADLQEADLQGAVLYDADLRDANLIKAKLQEAVLFSADLQGADLLEARLEGANLNGANLQGAGLLEARLEGAKLREANLQGTKLTGAKLEKANLIWADLEGADLEGADLWKAGLEGAKLTGANLQGANLSKANLREAKLEGANLIKANFLGANLSKADLTGANLQGARLEGANLDEAVLQGADLTDAVCNEETRGPGLISLMYGRPKAIPESCKHILPVEPDSAEDSQQD